MNVATPDETMYHALKQGSGYVPLAGRTQIEVTGGDRAKLLHSFCTANVNALSPGEGCEAFILNGKGKVLGFVYLFCQVDSIVMETVPDQAEKLIAHLDRYVIREDVRFQDQTETLSELLLAGDKAAACLRAAGVVELPQAYCGSLESKIEARDVFIRKVEWTGPHDFLISCNTCDIEAVLTALTATGATACDQSTFEVARIEFGTPLYGIDISDENLPQELNRDQRAISFTKGCYLGQETVARLDAMGHVNKVFVGVRFEQDAEIESGAEWQADGKSIGKVTSVCRSPQVDGVLARGYVKTKFAAPGSAIVCNGAAGEVVPY